MKIVGQRLRTLRESIKFSQAKIGAMFGCKQSSINVMKMETPLHPTKCL